jgi:hypothetical protein
VNKRVRLVGQGAARCVKADDFPGNGNHFFEVKLFCWLTVQSPSAVDAVAELPIVAALP